MDDGLQLVDKASVLHVCKGKKVTTLNLKSEKPEREHLAKLLLGPTGNLRAPTIKIGKTLIVGFNEDVFRATLL